MYTVADIAAILQARVLGAAPGDTLVLHLATDTRRIHTPAGSVFFALVTAQGNGHRYLTAAYNRGVRFFVVSENIDTGAFPDAVWLQVPDTLQALQQLAAFHRRRFDYPVVGITGSNGKTTVKEWLYHLLQPEVSVVRSPRSYNSQVGVPLSVWQMSAVHQVAVFEAGISRRGEMQALQQVIRPGIGVFTHLGEAHQEGFDSLEEKLEEKWKLFSEAEVLVLPADDDRVNRLAARMAAGKKIIRFGRAEDADLRLVGVDKHTQHATLHVRAGGSDLRCDIPFSDEASVSNALCCLAVCMALHTDPQTVLTRLASLPAVEMRLRLEQGINHSVIINDVYSFDIDSFRVALDFLVQQRQNYTTTTILSDLPAGTDASVYATVCGLLQAHHIDKCIFIGSEWPRQLAGQRLNLNSTVYASVAEFTAAFMGSAYHRAIILLKGAREFRFERLLPLFGEKVHQTQMQIDLNAVVHNLGVFRSLLQPGTRLMAMVKAFGYGSGGAELAKVLEFHNIDYLAVAYADEGVDLRRQGVKCPILVLNVDEAAFAPLVEYDLEPEVFSFSILDRFCRYLEKEGIRQFPIHIKIDTGMHRLGFDPADTGRLLQNLLVQDWVKVQSVFSHLAGSEEPALDAFTQQQFRVFEKAVDELRKGLRYPFLAHLSNTAAIFRHPELQLDMVRLGIGLYGGLSLPELPLQTVATLTTTIAQLRKVPRGETIGYNRKGVVHRDSDIAVIRIGYADGYRRAFGNGRAYVWVRGQKAPVIGNVCMDMTMVDVTGIEGVQEGDTVEVLGPHVPVEELAQAAGTIAYEILSGIGQRVKRVYIME